MKVSLNTIRTVNGIYGSAGEPAPDGVDALVEKIGAQLGAVEEVVPYGERFDGVLVAKVMSCEDHPNADRLHVCKIDDGGKAAGVERDDDGFVQVVCGAPNVREGLTVAWLPPGSTVPNTLGKDPFVLESRALRGVVSNGMLASPAELTIGDWHEGILELDGDVQPGTPFVDAYKLQDEAIIDIENKMFTHRPDCFGALGVAREIAGIYGKPYRSPAWYTLDPEVPGIEAEELKLEVRNEVPELVPRYSAIVMRDITVKPSPVWLQIYLASVGLRPINNIVDYTNFFMLETGQPLHAFDYDKVRALSDGEHARIVVRHPRPGEKAGLLNGKEIEPRDEAILITTGERIVGLGGVMGAGNSEIDENSKNIIIESATFDMYNIRRTSMVHGLFTDAVTRFNKGQSPLQTKAVLMKIVDEIRRHADGKVASPLIDDNHLPAEVLERGSLFAPVSITAQFINERLGVRLSLEEVGTLLTNVEFKVEGEGNNMLVTAPFWRTDIVIREDIVEEVGRLYGYDHLPLELPKRDLTPTPKDPMLETKAKVRAVLRKAGANEVLTYSFVHGNMLDKVGQDREQAYRLSNALSPDLQYYRMSLTPSLLDLVHSNVKAGHEEFALFELGKVHVKGFEDEGLPTEFDRVAAVFAADKKPAREYAGAAYYQARTYLSELLHAFGIAEDVAFEPLEADDKDVATTYYAPGRAATVKVGGVTIGRIGEYSPSVCRSFKLPDFCAGFELGLEPLHGKQIGNAYVALPRFPKVEQDICLRVAAAMPYQQLVQFVEEHLAHKRPDRTFHTLSPIDIYQDGEGAEHKHITFRLSIASYERTLTDEEVNGVLDRIADAAHNQFGADRV